MTEHLVLPNLLQVLQESPDWLCCLLYCILYRSYHIYCSILKLFLLVYFLLLRLELIKRLCSFVQPCSLTLSLVAEKKKGSKYFECRKNER